MDVMGTAGKSGDSSFVLTFDSYEDPSSEETSKVLETLKGVQVETIVPGTMKVTGPAPAVEKAAQALDNWSLSEEKQLSHNPPPASRIRK